MPEVKISDLSKRFGDVIAVDHIDLMVIAGELLTLLGPSGCGKTTTLRCVAGLEVIDSGEIRIGDMVVGSREKRIFVPPEKRNLGMVFQSYALWPHMRVFDNIAYGLQLRKVPKREIRERVSKVLDLLGLSGLEDRLPSQLSGGQQQRTALARSIVLEPRVMLFDEPLSNLDARLRERTRLELKALQRRLGITSIYVTHDQAEAMVLSDRMAIMNQGRIHQLGTPVEIYEKPSDKFVTNFVGTGNLFKGIITEVREEEFHEVETEIGKMLCTVLGKVEKGKTVTIFVRPEDVTINRRPVSKRNIWRGKICRKAYFGSYMDYFVDLNGTEIQVRTVSRTPFEEGEYAYIHVDPNFCRSVGV